MSTEATYAQIAHLLGVSRNQVYMWGQRRERNGFPEPVGTYRGSDGRCTTSPVFDLNEVVAWYVNYDPKAGAGAPRGNQNGFKHGRYVGLKAKRREAARV